MDADDEVRIPGPDGISSGQVRDAGLGGTQLEHFHAGGTTQLAQPERRIQVHISLQQTGEALRPRIAAPVARLDGDLEAGQGPRPILAAHHRRVTQAHDQGTPLRLHLVSPELIGLEVDDHLVGPGVGLAPGQFVDVAHAGALLNPGAAGLHAVQRYQDSPAMGIRCHGIGNRLRVGNQDHVRIPAVGGNRAQPADVVTRSDSLGRKLPHGAAGDVAGLDSAQRHPVRVADDGVGLQHHAAVVLGHIRPAQAHLAHTVRQGGVRSGRLHQRELLCFPHRHRGGEFVRMTLVRLGSRDRLEHEFQAVRGIAFERAQRQLGLIEAGAVVILPRTRNHQVSGPHPHLAALLPGPAETHPHPIPGQHHPIPARLHRPRVYPQREYSRGLPWNTSELALVHGP